MCMQQQSPAAYYSHNDDAAILTSQCVRNEVDIDHVDPECCHQASSKLVTLTAALQG